VKVVAISPRPSDDEAAAIAAALARVYAASVKPELRSGHYYQRSTSRASLGTLHPDPERNRSWRETARLESLDAGV